MFDTSPVVVTVVLPEPPASVKLRLEGETLSEMGWAAPAFCVTL